VVREAANDFRPLDKRVNRDRLFSLRCRRSRWVCLSAGQATQIRHSDDPAAAHQVIFFAIAFNSTSCNAISAPLPPRLLLRGVHLWLPPPLFQSGQLIREFNRTDPTLATGVQ
jgi:hypothetical protein